MIGSLGGILIMSMSAPAQENEKKADGYMLGILLAGLGACCMSFIYVSTNRMK